MFLAGEIMGYNVIKVIVYLVTKFTQKKGKIKRKKSKLLHRNSSLLF